MLPGSNRFVQGPVVANSAIVAPGSDCGGQVRCARRGPWSQEGCMWSNLRDSAESACACGGRGVGCRLEGRRAEGSACLCVFWCVWCVFEGNSSQTMLRSARDGMRARRLRSAEAQGVVCNAVSRHTNRQMMRKCSNPERSHWHERGHRCADCPNVIKLLNQQLN